MHSTSFLSRAPFLHRAFLAFVASCTVTACASDMDAAPQRTLAFRHASQQHPLRKSRVIVREFVPSLSAARTTTAPSSVSAGQAICAQLTTALAARRDVVIVDPVDVESAPAAFRERLADYAIRLELGGDAKSITSLELTLSATRKNTEIERFKHAFDPAAASPTLDELILRAIVEDVCEAIARRPWTTTVLDKAERTLIIGGGRSNGIALGERLSVRRHAENMYEEGIDDWINIAGQQIAQIIVESYVGDGRTERGAQCRLVAGTIGGFEADELWVEDVAPDMQ